MAHMDESDTKPQRKPRDQATISYTMSRIRSKDTTPEVALRKALWAAGLRYRKHYKKAPGSPDIAIVHAKVAVFCDGIFWHGRNWEDRKKRIKSNRDYWIPKIERNMARDRKANKELAEGGWFVIRFWETDIKDDLAGCVGAVIRAVESRSPPSEGT